jgi:crossover junction endodeoxyribonuclease RuvC
MIILGVDPGTATTGYGIVKIQNPNLKIQNRLACLGYGSIKTSPAVVTAERLRKIHDELGKLINKHKPNILAVESLYFFKNLKTALPVSQAKGVILLAAAEKNIPTREFTPLQVKMAVSGYGRAEKKQVQRLVQALLGLKELPEPDDAADALAVAICCAAGLDRHF